jgi:hypothetical protein
LGVKISNKLVPTSIAREKNQSKAMPFPFYIFKGFHLITSLEQIAASVQQWPMQNSMLTFHLNIIMKTDNILLVVDYFWL